MKFSNLSLQQVKERIGAAKQTKAQLVAARADEIDTLETLYNKYPNSSSSQPEVQKVEKKVAEQKEQILNLAEEISDGIDEVVSRDGNPNLKTSAPGKAGRSGDVEQWQAVAGDKKGQKIAVLGPKASLNPNPSAEDVNEYLRGRVRGFTGGRSVHNDMSETGSTDTALVPEPLSQTIIDKARAKSRIFQAGARTVSMDSKTLTIAKVKDDAGVDWKKENKGHNASDVSFEPLKFEAHTLIGSVKSSVELAEDSGNLASLVQDNLAQQIGLELDRAALFGTGTAPQPKGIVNVSGVQANSPSTNGDELKNYNPFSLAYQAIMAENGQANAAIFAPRVWGSLDRLTGGDKQPLNPPASYRNLAKLPTTQVPTDQTQGTASDATTAIVGDFSTLLIGVRNQLRLEVSRVASDDGGSAFDKLQIWFRVYARYDVQLAIPTHFYQINGLIPAS